MDELFDKVLKKDQGGVIESNMDIFLKNWCGTPDHKKQVEYYEAATDEEKQRIDSTFDEIFDGFSETWRNPENAAGDYHSCCN